MSQRLKRHTRQFMHLLRNKVIEDNDDDLVVDRLKKLWQPEPLEISLKTNKVLIAANTVLEED